MTWDIWPRDANLGRTLDPISTWSEMTVIERYVSNGPTTWTLTGPAEDLAVFTPGMGCLLDQDGQFVASGQVQPLEREFVTNQDSGHTSDTVTLGFVADTDDLWSRLCYPDPAHELTGIPSNFAVAYDERTGLREDLILGYTSDNLGPAAPITARRLNDLLLPISLGRGGSTTVQARMDVLGDLVAQLAEDADLDVRIEHDESTGTPRLALVVWQVSDVSDDIVFGSADAARATGIVTSWRTNLTAPQLTDAILFSAGDHELREGSRFTDEAAVARWARRRERLIDQGYTDDLSAITDAGAQALADGASPVSLEFSISDGGDAIYRETYRLGDRVGIELPGLPLELSAPRVREVVTTVRPDEPDSRTVVVGSPGATSITPPDAARLVQTMHRVAQLERSR